MVEGRYKRSPGIGARGEQLLMTPTRGKTYKNDTQVQVALESRLLAQLTIWMESKGIQPKFLSQVVRTSLEYLLEVLQEVGDVRGDISTDEARQVLTSRFDVNLNNKGRGFKNLLHNQMVSEAVRGLKVNNPRPAPSSDGLGDEMLSIAKAELRKIKEEKD